MQRQQDSGISLRQMVQWSVASQTGSRLLILTGEIRTRVYEYVLTVPPNKKGKVFIKHMPAMPAGLPSARRPPSALAILQTCRLIYQEAAGIFYANNRLELDLHSQYIAFLENLSPPRLQALRVLSVAVPSMIDAGFLMKHIEDRGGFHCLRSWASSDLEGRVSVLRELAEEMISVEVLEFEFHCGLDEAQKKEAALLVDTVKSGMLSKETRQKWREGRTRRQELEKASLLREFGTLSV